MRKQSNRSCNSSITFLWTLVFHLQFNLFVQNLCLCVWQTLHMYSWVWCKLEVSQKGWLLRKHCYRWHNLALNQWEMPRQLQCLKITFDCEPTLPPYPNLSVYCLSSASLSHTLYELWSEESIHLWIHFLSGSHGSWCLSQWVIVQHVTSQVQFVKSLS